MNENVIYDLLRVQADRLPDAPAVSDELRSLTRGELDGLIGTIAAKIPKSAKTVGILMEHTVEMIAAIFAVLKAGKAYVPIEPFFPRERIAYMLRDAGADVVIANTAHSAKAGGIPAIVVDRGMKIEPESDASALSAAGPDDIAYILYTSGSTGSPKGVAVYNRNVCHYARAFQNEFHIGVKDTMLQYSTCSFDIFVEEVFATLLSGASLAIPSEETKKDIWSLMRFVGDKGVTIISGFPYLLLEMNHLPRIPESLRLLISGGDVLRAGYVTNLIGKVEIYNTYGPSETTVCASYFRCNGTDPLPDGSYPVGRPVLGVEIEILDEDMSPVPAGEIGEICISGGGVSAGYVGGASGENGAFIALADGSPAYRSGDLGYFLPDGNIAFSRRKDTQVMILGKRVEPAEVEGVLCGCSGIETAAVRAYPDGQGLYYMIAYIVLKDDRMPVSSIKKEMSDFLPDYMIPEFFVSMRELPLNDNGKVDSAALPVVLKEGSVS